MKRALEYFQRSYGTLEVRGVKVTWGGLLEYLGEGVEAPWKKGGAIIQEKGLGRGAWGTLRGAWGTLGGAWGTLGGAWG